MNRTILTITCLFFSLLLAAKTPEGSKMEMYDNTQNEQQRQPFNPDEYKRKREEFIIEKCNLTQDEMNTVRPTINEMFDKLHEVSQKNRNAIRTFNQEKKSEAEAQKALEEITLNDIESKKIERTYYLKIAKALSYEKAISIRWALDKFKSVALRDFAPKDDKKHGPKREKRH